MKNAEVIFERLPEESYSEQKIRFQKALNEVIPHMDKYYSQQTARKFPARNRVHIRAVKQTGVVDWPVLKYWYSEYMPVEAYV
ncbi:hypothetical protein [Hymenobacter metallicola]|uniref:Uncharacterized protein n=1 Tax=Hymenobacter metallicola TaxID=2563114 RepID=A0A4Z0QJ25_9BACT|nr:hypothetical protein [Hymenobacter metallicola]TGE29705.1 hypothetical protein E5K02_09680 [Hymenobacter metallicola]